MGYKDIAVLLLGLFKPRVTFKYFKYRGGRIYNWDHLKCLVCRYTSNCRFSFVSQIYQSMQNLSFSLNVFMLFYIQELFVNIIILSLTLILYSYIIVSYLCIHNFKRFLRRKKDVIVIENNALALSRCFSPNASTAMVFVWNKVTISCDVTAAAWKSLILYRLKPLICLSSPSYVWRKKTFQTVVFFFRGFSSNCAKAIVFLYPSEAIEVFCRILL